MAPKSQLPSSAGDETLHKSVRYLLALTQCFGLIPCDGIFASTSSKLRFEWIGAKCCYSFLILAVHAFMASMSLVDLFMRGISFRTCNVVMIYVPGLVIHACFMRLGRDWPFLMRKWSILESSMREYGYPKHLNRSIRFKVILILMASVLEYASSLWNSIQILRKSSCTDEETILHAVFVNQFEFIISYIPYHAILAIFALICNFFCMVIWNLMDLYIIVLSTALAERYKQITICISSAPQWKIAQELFWKKIREDYNNVTSLFRHLEETISWIVLLSFSINLYYILVQLFNFLNNSGVSNLYFFSSFWLLLGRTIAVSLYAARINEESKKPLHYLPYVPSQIYSTEIERLMMQIHYDNIALTGNKLFSITRGLIFTIAGTIVTYELFLFQFNVRPSIY